MTANWPKRFATKVRIGGPDECWLWTAYKQARGYGKFSLRRRLHMAHRLAWQWQHGEIPPGLFVLHRCDTPACVNPNHLFLGTNAENVADRTRKGRSAQGALARRLGERNGSSRLTEAQVRSILADGRLQRQIAEDFGVTQTAVSKIRRRQRWRHLQEAA